MEDNTQPKSNIGRSVLWIVVIAVVILGGFAFSRNTAQEAIKIGVIAPLTGNQASYGEGIKEGIDLAFQEWQGKPIQGRSLELIYEDTRGEVKNVLSAAEKLISVDKVVAVISGGPSQEAVALVPLAEQYKIPMYMAVSQAPELTDAGDFVFRGMPGQDLLGARIAEVAYAKGFRKASMLSANYNQATKASAEAFRKEFESRGGAVALVEEFGPNTTDFRTVLGHIGLKKPDVLFVNGLTTDDGLIMKQARELGIKAVFVSQGGVEDKKVIETAGGATEGVLFASFNASAPDAFAEKVKAKYGKDARRWNSEGFEALQFVFAGLGQAKTLDPVGVREGLANVRELDGVSAKLLYDEKGNVTRPVFVKKIENGQFVLLAE